MTEVKLKCLDLAVQSSKGSGVRVTPEEVLAIAAKFEHYVNIKSSVKAEAKVETKGSPVNLDKRRHR